MKIAFIGIGNVGAALGDRLQKLGHDVTIAARDPQSKSVQEALARNSALKVESPTTAVSTAEVVFLATPFPAINSALTPLQSALDGKILVDCTNPVSAGLKHGLDSKISGSETIQQIVPHAYVVKAFTIYGYENFENSQYPGYGDLQPAMLIAGDDLTAKKTVADLCSQLGWEAVDTGNLSMSLHLEHMTLLWIKMARVQGLGVDFTWAMLKR
ncbi:NADPH-dependent F420 reductase [Anabaena sp. PCC 7108]|uniref:NADPH-dependent F420 reductase n=1 Tax=Anabaena sp. PCC 7108 TaxID=163908 RepID=UPI00034A1033|nr:NADPH-dependent F420 reductase [Anabaena sp. PCC 7108]